MHGESENRKTASERTSSIPATKHTKSARKLDRTIITTQDVRRFQMGTLDRVLDAFSEDDTRPEYACLACETGYDIQYHVCPECGGYSVERLDW